MLVNIFIKRLWTGGDQCRGELGERASGVVMSRGWGVEREQALSFTGSQPDSLERTECKLRQQEEILQMTLPETSCQREARPVNKTLRPEGGLC